MSEVKKAGGEEMFEGFPSRLFDGYDGGGERPEPGEAEAMELLKDAPPEVKARAEEWAKQRAAMSGKNGADEGATEQPEGEETREGAGGDSPALTSESK